jgi:hypothetical protein
MLYAITAVTMSSTTRRRTGKATTTVIDTEAADKLFAKCGTPLEVERRYERLHNAGTTVPVVKVVDVKQLLQLKRDRAEQDHNIAQLNAGFPQLRKKGGAR